MKTLLHQNLDSQNIPNFKKLRSQLEAGDFRSADARKIGNNIFRARLDRNNRILFSFARHHGETFILILEYIPNHNYEKSRFLARGAKVDETQPLVALESLEGAEELSYVNTTRSLFNVLDKIIFFDDAQHEAYALNPPFIVIGSAGSGKTVLTLEKLKQVKGDVLYVTRSPHLADKSRETYYGLNYENEDQEASFLSYAEFLETIRVPQTREISFANFAEWFSRHAKAAGLKDAYRLFEEFNGVITSASGTAYLARDEYENLGVRQSIYAAEDRKRVYGLFVKYLALLKESGWHDINILSQEYHSLVKKEWDFIVIDEVQDFTNVQLELVLKSLRDPYAFILSGDSNQIVHPNFFSWSGLKSHLYEKTSKAGKSEFRPPADLIRVLSTNYRNSREVTEMANRILRLKHARFGSIDRESNHLVTSNSSHDGIVTLLSDAPEITEEIDTKTHASTRYAVIVLHPEQKAIAKKHFRTPLVFSVQEAKGLEYENVVLYGFISGDEHRFREIARDVNPEQVRTGELRYARAKDKTDKSLEIYKFHINAFYVAVTRAIRMVYLVESKPQQSIYQLMEVELFEGDFRLEDQKSSLVEWSREAQKLERQGKVEQAEDIRKRVLGIRAIPWKPLDKPSLEKLTNAVYEGSANRKDQLYLYEYALLSNDNARLNLLKYMKYRPALTPKESGLRKLADNHFMAYSFKHTKGVRNLVDKYGVDYRDQYNFTPMMLAARFGNEQVLRMLSGMNARKDLVNSAGLTSFQIMLQQASLGNESALKKLESIFDLLAPSEISLMVQGRLVKIDSHKSEFLMVNLFMALFYTSMSDNFHRPTFGPVPSSLGLASADFLAILENLPRSVIQEYRTKRTYISSVLSRNEVGRKLSSSRRIFKRTVRGFYILNPEMSVRVGQEWVPIDELLSPENVFAAIVHKAFRLNEKDNQISIYEKILFGKSIQWAQQDMLCEKRKIQPWATFDVTDEDGSRDFFRQS